MKLNILLCLLICFSVVFPSTAKVYVRDTYIDINNQNDLLFKGRIAREKIRNELAQELWSYFSEQIDVTNSSGAKNSFALTTDEINNLITDKEVLKYEVLGNVYYLKLSLEANDSDFRNLVYKSAGNTNNLKRINRQITYVGDHIDSREIIMQEALNQLKGEILAEASVTVSGEVNVLYENDRHKYYDIVSTFTEGLVRVVKIKQIQWAENTLYLNAEFLVNEQELLARWQNKKSLIVKHVDIVKQATKEITPYRPSPWTKEFNDLIIETDIWASTMNQVSLGNYAQLMVKWDKLAEKGDVDAQSVACYYNTFFLLSIRNDVFGEKDFKWCWAAANKGVARAQAILSIYLMQGLGIQENRHIGLLFAQEAEKNFDQQEIGIDLIKRGKQRRFFEDDIPTFKYYPKLFFLSDNFIQEELYFLMGQMYERGVVVEKSIVLAQQIYQKCNLINNKGYGEGNCLYRLAELYEENGRYELAKKTYKSVDGKYTPLAQVRSAALIFKGLVNEYKGLKKTQRQAKALLLMLQALEKTPYGTSVLALDYIIRLNIPDRYLSKLPWFKKTAKSLAKLGWSSGYWRQGQYEMEKGKAEKAREYFVLCLKQGNDLAFKDYSQLLLSDEWKNSIYYRQQSLEGRAEDKMLLLKMLSSLADKGDVIAQKQRKQVIESLKQNKNILKIFSDKLSVM